jgi:ADP-ribose pyrophosphatase YjhB (NUDIX family)
MVAETHPDIRRTLLFFVKDNQILLAMKKRGFGAGKWNGVGGKIEADETIEQALVRESIEEVSMKPLSWVKVAELDFVQDATTDPWHMYVHAYIAREWEGEPVESEEMKPQWYSLNDIPYSNMWDDDQYWLPRVLAGEKVEGNFVFDENDAMTAHEIRTAKF